MVGSTLHRKAAEDFCLQPSFGSTSDVHPRQRVCFLLPLAQVLWASSLLPRSQANPVQWQPPPTPAHLRRVTPLRTDPRDAADQNSSPLSASPPSSFRHSLRRVQPSPPSPPPTPFTTREGSTRRRRRRGPSATPSPPQAGSKSTSTSRSTTGGSPSPGPAPPRPSCRPSTSKKPTTGLSSPSRVAPPHIASSSRGFKIGR